jgi:hypothetical protein
MNANELLAEAIVSREKQRPLKGPDLLDPRYLIRKRKFARTFRHFYAGEHWTTRYINSQFDALSAGVRDKRVSDRAYTIWMFLDYGD